MAGRLGHQTLTAGLGAVPSEAHVGGPPAPMTELILPTAHARSTRRAAYNARLVRREDENESLAYFWVRFDGEPTPFESGQYMTIGVMVDGKIVQRPYSVASAPAVAGVGRVRVLRSSRAGRDVHASAVGAAGRPRHADDRTEGQVHAPARRRPDAHLHLVGNRQRAIRRDDPPAHDRQAAAPRGVPQRRLVRRRAGLSRDCSRSGRIRAASR